MKLLRDPSSPRSTFFVNMLAIFVLAAILIYPLFKLKYMNNWGSIESTFISDARMLKENFPHPGWQPYWYCGTRWDYIYPPALRYGTAVIATILPVIPARAYHIYTGIFFCLGIAGVYLMVRLGSESRRAGWAAAFAVATLSPIFLFIDYVRHEASVSMWVPQRLSVLLRYGEGPHISSLSILAFALGFSWIALKSSRPAAMAAAGISCALVVANNFYGATALAMSFPILFWALWVTHQDRGIVLRALGIVGIAFGLSASWLTPSYLRVTVENLKIVAEPGNLWSVGVQVAFLIVFGVASRDWAKKRKELAWLLFLIGGFSLFSLHVLGNHYFKFLAFGVPLRLMPEFDLFFLLLAVELLRRTTHRVPVILACAVAVLLAVPFLSHAWKIYPWDGGHKGRIEYQITEWIHQNMPHARSFTTGSLRFWYNAWFTGAEVGGGSDQGLLNHILLDAQYQIAADDNRDLSILWLQATGADIIVVHDKNSKEVYHDYAAPQKFEGLPVVWDNGAGDRIYQIPRRFPGIARVVNTAGVASLRGIRDGDTTERLRSYVDVIEKGPDSPAIYGRESTDVIRVKANIAEGQSVTVLESFDPAWRAYSGSQALSIRKDIMGFMLIETPPGQHDLRIVFETPLENQMGRAVTFLTLCAVFYLLFVLRKREA